MTDVGKIYASFCAFAQAKLATIIAFYDIPWPSAQEKQELVGLSYESFWCFHTGIIFLSVFFPVNGAEWFSYWTPIGLTTLCFILLGTLKHRTVSHRKSYELLRTNSNGESKNTLMKCLQKIFYCEAKMTPCSFPPLASLWRVLCYLVVCKLFPKCIVYVYFAVAWLKYLVHFFMSLYLSEFFRQRSDLVYNGRWFKVSWAGAHYSTIQDKEQNTLYYPTIDLYGLVAPGNL